LKKIEKGLPRALSLIYNIQKTPTPSKTDIEAKIYKGKKEVMALYKEILLVNELYSFVNLDKYYEVFPSTEQMFIDSYKKNAAKEVWDIAVDSRVARSIQKLDYIGRYHLKLLPSKNFFSEFEYADYQIYPGYVALIQLEPNNVQAILIKSDELYKSFRGLHKMVWELLPEIK
jgi:hypothetical protein